MHSIAVARLRRVTTIPQPPADKKGVSKKPPQYLLSLTLTKMDTWTFS